MSYPLHAVYATTQATREHEAITFRVGLPTTHDNAHRRHQRFDVPAYYGRERFGVTVGRTVHQIVTWEVREVDAYGRGLGSARHARAIPVHVHDVNKLPERPHTLRMARIGIVYFATVETAEDAASGRGSHPMKAQRMARLNARMARII